MVHPSLRFVHPRLLRPARTFVPVLACLFSLLLGSCGQPNDRDVKLMSVAKARQLWLSDKAAPKHASIFLDARGDTAYQRAHIPGAMLFSWSSVSRITKPDPTLKDADWLIVYGDSPGSSGAMGAAKQLILLGYDDVHLLEGGLLSWRTHGGELEGADLQIAPK